MSDLLTTKQVQNLLQIDRTTIYRMLKDGRLTGVKVGHQWRFPASQIKNLLNGRVPTHSEETSSVPQNNLPVACFQLMQDVFSDITEIGAVTTKPDGTPLTQTSRTPLFCQMLLNSETGSQACRASRREMANSRPEYPSFTTCHAGLHCLPAPITINNAVDAVFIAGHFYSDTPDAAEETARVRRLAQKHNLDEAQLANAVRDILILDNRQKMRIASWLNKIAATFEHISCERVSFMNRLQRIAHMSDLNHDPLQPAAQQLGQL